MDQIGGTAVAARSRRHRHHKPAERFLGILQPQPPSSAAPIELSEHDIFATPSGSSSPSPPRRNPISNPAAARSIHRNQHGILAAINANNGSRSGAESRSGHDIQPVFNHRAFVATSFSSSSSASPATPVSSRMAIPRPPPRLADSVRVHHQSAPVNIPVMSKGLRRREVDLEDALSEGEDEDDSGVRLPPHEVVASRYSPLLACSVMEGHGRTLKGRDLRQRLPIILNQEASQELYTGQVLKGSVNCLDCPRNSDLSGLQVLVKCDKVKKLAMAYTEEDGTFTTELPSDDGSKPVAGSPNCMAKIMGGAHQLYISADNSIVPIANAKGNFATSRPLDFYKTCPPKGKCEGKDMGFASSKTVDLPLPREWGLAPSSYYIPFIPIIGIP